MRSDGLSAADWQVVTEYMDVLGPLKESTKRLKGRSGQGKYGSIAEIILVFEYLLSVLESRLQSYEDVIHNAHEEAPENHLAINLRAAIVKAREYYNKFNLSPAYYAATILYPRYKYYCDVAREPQWLELNNRNFQALWEQYKGLRLSRPSLHAQIIANNIDDTIDCIVNLGAASSSNKEDEFEQWKRCELCAAKGSTHAIDSIRY
jgi:hypothetical protein